MLELHPFRGIIYNQDRIRDFSKVLTPPYDVISSWEQDFYYRAHPHNVIRIILGKDEVGDTAAQDKYTRAAVFFRQWLAEGVLQKEKFPAFYTYCQRYFVRDNQVEREGFIALMKIEDFASGKIFPHENVFLEPQKDRFKLLKACHANFSPIFILFNDARRDVDAVYEKGKPLVEFEDQQRVTHKLSYISDVDSINKIFYLMQNKKVFIADGHHRYLTALAFRNEVTKQANPPLGKDYVMAYFLNMNSPGVTILPVHRLIGGLTPEKAKSLTRQIEQFFYKKPFERLREEDEANTAQRLSLQIEQTSDYRLGMYSEAGGFSLLFPRDERFFSGRIRAAILDELLKSLLGKKDLMKGREIDFTTNSAHAVREVKQRHSQIAFFLAPAMVEEIQKVALTGGKMPPKSSYFYPKLLSGLVVRDLEDAV